ncbi:MAG: hypothetical protein NXH83_17225 [Rhodobacteraceae bacterium]|nr:hypothetical protein [Paracoccaceae bacterium]
MTNDDLENYLTTAKLVAWAEQGDPLPLVRYIEEGGAIGPTIRAFLSRHLRGEISKKPGNPKEKANHDRRSEVAMLIWMDCFFSGKSLYSAQEEFLRDNPKMNRKTLESYCREFGVTGKSVERFRQKEQSRKIK